MSLAVPLNNNSVLGVTDVVPFAKMYSSNLKGCE